MRVFAIHVIGDWPMTGSELQCLSGKVSLLSVIDPAFDFVADLGLRSEQTEAIFRTLYSRVKDFDQMLWVRRAADEALNRWVERGNASTFKAVVSGFFDTDEAKFFSETYKCPLLIVSKTDPDFEKKLKEFVDG